MILLLPVLLTACATDSGTDPTVPTTAADTTTTTHADEGTPRSGDGFPVEAAIDDLAIRLGLASDVIEIVLTEAIVWNDGALGCPEPGMSYTQALVPGYRILLEANGDTYAYHGADDGDPFLCIDRIAEGAPRERP